MQFEQISTMFLTRRQFVKNALVGTASGGWISVALGQAKEAVHIVHKGETLGHLALRYDTTVEAIRQANGLSGDLIRIGQKLHIPATRSEREFDSMRAVRDRCARIAVRPDNWKRIVAHHSGIRYGNAEKYDSAHRRRGMQNGLAYHFVIGNGIDSGDGEIEVGPRWKQQLLGGHVKTHAINLTAIGICLVGNFERTYPSRKQIKAFVGLMNWLREDVLKKRPAFAGHKELPGEQTVCPGKHFPLATMHRYYS